MSDVDSAAAGSKDAASAAATTVGEKVAAVSAAISVAHSADSSAIDTAEARATEASARANASLREATAAAAAAVESAAAEVDAAAGKVTAAVDDAEAAATKHNEVSTTAMGDLGKDVASHVADVDLAHEPVEPVMPVAPPAFSRAISATAADEVVLSGGAVVAPVVHKEEETFEDAEGEVVDVFGEVDAPAVEDAPAPAPAPAVDAENVVPTVAPAKKSLASMREGFKSKIAAPAGAERRTFGALKDVNAQ
jgi:hypothetical protein